MLDLSAKNLHEEIRLAEGFRDTHLDHLDDMLDVYGGEAYRKSNRKGWSENHPYEFIRSTTSRVIFDNPRVRVRSRQPGAQGEIAKAMQYGLNRWVKDVRLRDTLKRAYAHMCFGFAAIQMVNAEQPWMDPRQRVQSYWPECHLLGMKDFFFDPLAQFFGAARYVGHRFVRDKEDMLEDAESDPTWNRSAIEAVSENSGVQDLRYREDRLYSNDRKQVVCYEVWVPEDHIRSPEDGYNGALYTIAVGYNENEDQPSKFEYIREPRAFYGPKCGPYHLFGVYPMPNDPWPLAPLVATFQQQRELNEVTAAAHKAIKEYRRWVAVDAKQPDLLEMMKDAEDNFVYGLQGYKKDGSEKFETGGLTPQHIEHMADARGRIDRNSGQSDTNRGQVGTGSTATEIAVAEEALQSNLAYIKQQFTESTSRLLEGAAWYLYHDDQVAYPLGEEVAQQMQGVMMPDGTVAAPNPWFFGGAHWDGSGARFEDLELEIEPYSMERMNESLARAQYGEMLNLLTSVAPIIPQTPWVNWKKLFEMGGDVLNNSEFGDLVNVDIANAFMGMQTMFSQPGQTQFSKQSGGPGAAPQQGRQTGQQLAGRMGGGNGP